MSTPNSVDPSSGNPGPSEKEFPFLDGAVFVGDKEIPLACDVVKLVTSNAGRPTLKFELTVNDGLDFARAWQQYLHSGVGGMSRFPVSELVRVGSPHETARTEGIDRLEINYHEVQYADAAAFEIQYFDVGSAQSAGTSVHYFEVMYSSVSYMGVTYATAEGRQLRSRGGGTIAGESAGGDDPPPLADLTLTGSNGDGKRRVINLEGIEHVEIRQAAPGADLTSVDVELSSAFPVARLLWLVEGE